jgi:hypothetical protein
MRLAAAFKGRFVCSRALAGIRFDGKGGGQRSIYACLSPAPPIPLTFRLIRKVASGGKGFGEFLPALPHIALLNSVWAAGEFFGSTRIGSISVVKPS